MMNISGFASSARFFLICAMMLAVPAAVSAQNYPTKPVRLIIGFPPGGPTDIIIRLMSKRLSEKLGQPVLVENHPGAGGVIAANIVAKAPPDGHTFLATPISNHFISSLVQKTPPYDVLKDFTPIAGGTDVWRGIAISNKVPATSLVELIALAKRQPGKLSYSSAGVGTYFHLAGELFNRAAGVEIVHVPYKGAAQALAELRNGQIDMTFSGLAPMLQSIRDGQIRMVAVMNEGRHPDFPNIPALLETFPNFVQLDGSLGFFGPAGLPDSIIHRIHEGIVGAVYSAEVRAALENSGFRVWVTPPSEFAKGLERTREVFKAAVKDADLKPE